MAFSKAAGLVPPSLAAASGMAAGNSGGIELVRIPPHFYLHLTNSNTNTTRVIEGPQTYTGACLWPTCLPVAMWSVGRKGG